MRYLAAVWMCAIRRKTQGCMKRYKMRAGSSRNMRRERRRLARFFPQGTGGCNRLIKQGAGLVLSVEDFLKDLQIEAKSRRKVENFKKNLLEKPEMVVYSGLDFEPRSLDEIMKRTGMMLSEVSGALIGLQQKGKIKEVFKNYYVRS